ncbi:MAG: sterol desaturase family protein [Bacteroidota bacterium]
MEFVIITTILQAVLYTIAFGYSWAVIYGNFWKRFSIQKKAYRDDVFSRRLPLILINMSLVLILSFSGFYFTQDFYIMWEFPPIWLMLVQIATVILVDDFYFYFYHRTLHENKYLLKTIHKRHHTASKPFPMDYMYVHPLEWMLGTIGVVLGVSTVFLIFGEMHAWTFWTYICIRNFHEMHIHSGVKSTLVRHLSLIGTSDHHDLHHSKPVGNYSSTLKIWDKILGTEVKK